MRSTKLRHREYDLTRNDPERIEARKSVLERRRKREDTEPKVILRRPFIPKAKLDDRKLDLFTQAHDMIKSRPRSIETRKSAVDPSGKMCRGQNPRLPSQASSFRFQVGHA
jgi:hypothetical protein